MKNTTGNKYNMGCGSIRPEGWINVDSSFTSLMRRLPFGQSIVSKFGKEKVEGAPVVYMNLSKRWKGIGDQTAEIVYASHLFEHLTIKSRAVFLREAFRVLKPGGILRLVVPDLELHTRHYIRELDHGNTKASELFLWTLNLHRESQYPSGKKIHRVLGYLQGYPHQHKYMYDQYSLADLLSKSGFTQIQKSDFGESHYTEAVHQVEYNKALSYGDSLYLEAIRP
jgi:hypothetical protein